MTAAPLDEPPERTLCCWCPDWPVTTARRDAPALVGVPVAVVARGPSGAVVRAASAEARIEGVVPGVRRREAEARCPGLVVLDADPGAEARAFEAVARAVGALTPGIVLDRPGLLSFPTHGPARYFGGDEALAARVAAAAGEAGVPDVRTGVADGGFAARLAARRAGPGGRVVVPVGATPAFVAPWPVAVLAPVVDDGAALADLLGRLGVRTLGDLAALPGPAVLARFGTVGERARRLAAGLDEHAAPPVPPPPELVEWCELDPPATRVDEVAFAAKALADRLLARLEAAGWACTRVAVEAETEHGEGLARTWRHDGALTPEALAVRVRWQLEGWLQAGGGGGAAVDAALAAAGVTTGGLTLVRLVPDRVVPAVGRQLGLWGGDAAAASRADRALARLQGLLGHEAVVTAAPCGGRAPGERVRWVPWGEPRDDGPTTAERPSWPGTVPGPTPARVLEPPHPARLLDAAGRAVAVSGRGEASAPPARLECPALRGGGGAVTAWAGPWAHDVRWWAPDRRRRALWQVVVDGDVACLVTVEHGAAAVEAVYD